MQRENLAVLDSGKALPVSDDDRHRQEEFSHPDGLNLMLKAYEQVLGRRIPDFAKKIARQEGKSY